MSVRPTWFAFDMVNLRLDQHGDFRPWEAVRLKDEWAVLEDGTFVVAVGFNGPDAERTAHFLADAPRILEVARGLEIDRDRWQERAMTAEARLKNNSGREGQTPSIESGIHAKEKRICEGSSQEACSRTKGRRSA